MPSELNTWLATATSAVLEAGEMVAEYYRAESIVNTKGGDTRNLVTDADVASEASITAALRAAFPDHAILGEETYRPGDLVDEQVPTWAIDPIDGTSNFAHRLPLFVISVGLHHAGEGQVGVVHAPMLGWTFTAARGQGAFLNGEPIRVSQRAELSRALTGCDWPRDPELRTLALAAFSAFATQGHTARSMGAAALGLGAVAAGWLDIYFNYHLAPWDTAAGVLLIQEAGGHVTAPDGSPWAINTEPILATNGPLHHAAQAVLAPHLP
jgi:myo-inositol-1(or 4)-monophosphatase